jgi:hypothetical protein
MEKTKLISMVPLAAASRVSPEAMECELRDVWPETPPFEDLKDADGTLSFRVGSMEVLIEHMSEPIPWNELQEPCANSWLWQDAEAVLRPHRAHLVVVVSAEAPALECAMLLTQVTASILPSCNSARGVFWGPSRLLLRPAMFCAFAVDPGHRPLFVWIDFRTGRRAGNLSWGYTTGLEALGHKEFETENSTDSPSELRDRFFDLADYVLEHGPIIEDGNTVGDDSRAAIRAIHVTSAFGRPAEVIRLDWTQIEERKPWWRFGH